MIPSVLVALAPVPLARRRWPPRVLAVPLITQTELTKGGRGGLGCVCWPLPASGPPPAMPVPAAVPPQPRPRTHGWCAWRLVPRGALALPRAALCFYDLPDGAAARRFRPTAQGALRAPPVFVIHNAAPQAYQHAPLSTGMVMYSFRINLFYGGCFPHRVIILNETAYAMQVDLRGLMPQPHHLNLTLGPHWLHVYYFQAIPHCLLCC